MDNNELIKKLEEHKDHITTVKEWDDYAKENNLPPSVTLIYKFGTWNSLKSALKVPIISRTYNEEELKNIALAHKEYMISKKVWDSYYKESGLPSSSTFIKRFGQWNNIKKIIGFSTERRRSDLYSKEEIRNILKEHAENFENRKQWDEYAKTHRLPTYKTIKKHFEYEEILEIVNKRKTFNYTKEDLLRVAREHEIFLTSSMKIWDSYASENNLPSSYAFLRKFGTWRKAKHDIRRGL